MPNSEPVRYRWDISPTEAKQLQLDLRARVTLEDTGEPVQVVAGVDVGYQDVVLLLVIAGERE